MRGTPANTPTTACLQHAATCATVRHTNNPQKQGVYLYGAQFFPRKHPRRPTHQSTYRGSRWYPPAPDYPRNAVVVAEDRAGNRLPGRPEADQPHPAGDALHRPGVRAVPQSEKGHHFWFSPHGTAGRDVPEVCPFQPYAGRKRVHDHHRRGTWDNAGRQRRRRK